MRSLILMDKHSSPGPPLPRISEPPILPCGCQPSSSAGAGPRHSNGRGSAGLKLRAARERDQGACAGPAGRFNGIGAGGATAVAEGLRGLERLQWLNPWLLLPHPGRGLAATYPGHSSILGPEN